MGDACQPGPPTRTPAARGGPPGEQGAREQPPLVPTLARQGAGPPGTSRRPADPGEPACRMEQGHYHQAAPEPLTREIMRYNKMMIQAPRFGVICHAALGSEGPALLSPSGIAEGWHLSWGLRQALCLFGGGVLAGCGGRAAGSRRGPQPFPSLRRLLPAARASAKPAPLGPRWTLIPLCHRGTWLGSSPPQVPGTAAKTERWEPWAQAARLEAAALPRTPTASGLGTRSRAGARWQRAGRPGRGCRRAAGARPGHLGGQVAGRACAQGRPGVRAEGTGLHARLCRLLRTSFLWG